MWFVVKGCVVETINIHVHETGIIWDNVSLDVQDTISQDRPILDPKNIKLKLLTCIVLYYMDTKVPKAYVSQTK